MHQTLHTPTACISVRCAACENWTHRVRKPTRPPSILLPGEGTLWGRSGRAGVGWALGQRVPQTLTSTLHEPSSTFALHESAALPGCCSVLSSRSFVAPARGVDPRHHCCCVCAACALCIQTPCFQCPARFVCGRVTMLPTRGL